jgi:hypothetical protein
MVPMRMSTVFKNRWMALLWAAGFVWFAYDFAGSAPDPELNGANAEAPADTAAATATADGQQKIPAHWN